MIRYFKSISGPGLPSDIVILKYLLPENEQNMRRDSALDIFKSLLVMGMIIGHTIQLAVLNPSPIERGFSLVINLLTFSGFMFAYGAGVGLSTRGRPAEPWKALRRVLEIYGAYLVSSLAFILVDQGAWPNLLQIVQMATMARLYGFSEFLASFVILGAAATFLRPELKAWINRPEFLVLIVIIGIFSTLLTYHGAYIPFLPTLVGSDTFANFPIIPYSIWFIVGLLYAKRRQNISYTFFYCSVAGCVLIATYIIVFRHMPNRFPPSYIWVIGSSLPILIYIVMAKFLATIPVVSRSLTIPGKQTLSLLVGSNIILFALERYGKIELNFVAILFLSFGIIGILIMLRYLAAVFITMSRKVI